MMIRHVYRGWAAVMLDGVSEWMLLLWLMIVAVVVLMVAVAVVVSGSSCCRSVWMSMVHVCY